MDFGQVLPVVLGSSWTSGINLYMTVAGLGIAQRMHWVSLPGDMNTLAHPLVIGAAVLMYAVEFVADKIPFVDSAWDTIHTVIRPLGGAALGAMAAHNMGPAVQTAVGILTGAIALNAHLTKATARAAINAAPTGIGNSVASVTEDASVYGILFLIIKHPVIAVVLVIALIALSIWFLRVMFRFLRSFFRREVKPQPSAPSP